MTAAEFTAKWRRVELKERSAAQEHFLDLCRLVGHPTPAEADPAGETFCFEKGIAKHGGGDGFADVWKKGFFGWEYKGRHKDLEAAYNQLLLYRDALANPPLLVLCDLDRIIVRTNFTNTVSARHEIELEQLGAPRSIEILRAVFFDPDKLRPGQTSEAVTRAAAEQIAGIADSMRGRGLDAAAVAHFLDRVVFCLFAEDIGLLPDQLFTRIAESAANAPARFGALLGQLFAAMSAGGDFGLERIRHFNGSLFDEASVPDLTADEARRISGTARLDWSAVDPSIFGTLFERGLDPAKRSQLGAHFTGKDDIRMLVDAVVMTPLRREWDETRATVLSLLTTGKKSGMGVSPMTSHHGQVAPVTLTPSQQRKAVSEASSILHAFLTRLQNVKVLDPACGSGNFLYVALQALKDLEKEAIVFAMDSGLGSFLPMVGPWQLYGIEVNPYAHDLAQMTVWIGWLQWIRFNGFGSPAEPILRALPGNFQCRDAILDRRAAHCGTGDPPVEPASGEPVEPACGEPVEPARSEPVEPACGEPVEPDWPRVDFIVGNPPFLGGKMLRRELGDAYLGALFAVWDGRVPREADLCCYWFEKARAHIAAGGCRRAGLLATQGIRGGANREVLRRIKGSGDIFWAESDRDWVQDGANVHVSMAAFDSGEETTRTLDGRPVATINANLSAAADTTRAARLAANAGVAFMGDTKVGPFDIPEKLARTWLPLANPNGRPNNDVVRPWANGLEVTRAPQRLWIVDFPPGTSEADAAQYEAPFEYIRENVRPMRAANSRRVYAERWWIHAEARPDMREALKGLSRYLVTPCIAKHRIFAWLSPDVLPDHQLIVFAREDDAFFGLLHSHIHEVWALKQGTQLEDRPRYTPTTCFETFPLPEPHEGKWGTVATAAKALDEARGNWLGDRSDKTRTLTNLYNKRPQWLVNAHAALDAAVAAAYGWPADLPDDQILERLLALNLERAKA